MKAKHSMMSAVNTAKQWVWWPLWTDGYHQRNKKAAAERQQAADKKSKTATWLWSDVLLALLTRSCDDALAGWDQFTDGPQWLQQMMGVYFPLYNLFITFIISRWNFVVVFHSNICCYRWWVYEFVSLYVSLQSICFGFVGLCISDSNFYMCFILHVCEPLGFWNTNDILHEFTLVYVCH